MIIWRQLWSILWLTESSGLSLLLLGAMSTDMMRFDIYMQELLPAATNSETKKHSVKNLLNSRFTFRLWQILVFLCVLLSLNDNNWYIDLARAKSEAVINKFII